MKINSKNTEINLWSTLVRAIDRIQDKAIDAESSEALVTLLLEMDELPVDKSNIAIVYQNYGAKKPEFWAVGMDVRRREIDPVSYRTIDVSEEPQADFKADHQLISKVISTGNRELLVSNDECIREGLPKEYKSFLVVPMTIREERRIGAFILFSKDSEGAFTEEFSEIMTIFASRFAYFIRHNMRRRRNAAFQYIQDELYKKHYDLECALINDFVQGLTAWFEYDKVEILIKHPLNTHTFSRACCVDNRDQEGDLLDIHSIRDFRLKPVMSSDEVNHLLGNTLSDIEKQPLVFNSSDEITNRGITLPCKSWLATPMRLKKGVNIGYLILYNEDVEGAFDSDEHRLVDNLSDAVAMMIGTLRTDHFHTAQREIRESNPPQKGDSGGVFVDLLCKTTAESLLKLYGVQELTILRYRHSDAGLERTFNNNPVINDAFSATADEKQGFSRLIPNPDLINEIGTDKETKEHWVEVYFGTLKSAMMDVMLSSHHNNVALPRKTLHIKDEKTGIIYFVAPMRASTHSFGCFAFPASYIGDFTAQAVDDLSDTFGKRIGDHENIMRSQVITSFGRMISSGKVRNQGEILSLTKEFISKVMYTKHLYIALYDVDKKEIHFALALYNGNEWEGVHNTKRKLKLDKLGKTEKIIQTGEPILHCTRLESEEWYKIPGHKEHAGNALASWLGVPIFSEEGVAGVIATYHESLDYIFSERDKFFLQQIAGDVSGMLRALKLNDAKSLIEYQKNEIIKKDSDIKNRITFRKIQSIIKKPLDRLKMLLHATAYDVGDAIRNKDTYGLQDIIEILDEGKSLVDKISGDIESVHQEAWKNLKVEEMIEIAFTDENHSGLRNIGSSSNAKHTIPSGNLSDEEFYSAISHVFSSIKRKNILSTKNISTYKVIDKVDKLEIRFYFRSTEEGFEQLVGSAGVAKARAIFGKYPLNILEVDYDHSKDRVEIYLSCNSGKAERVFCIHPDFSDKIIITRIKQILKEKGLRVVNIDNSLEEKNRRVALFVNEDILKSIGATEESMLIYILVLDEDYHQYKESKNLHIVYVKDLISENKSKLQKILEY